ncbi:MAG: alpha-L-arabinofuranosidase [Streptosporangiales bacterium]|nr:alpha-L-arabinofuranosidase [Streptosporangiales bacterium]
MGRCVYTGIYEPGHPQATAEGFRRDVLELARELGVTVVRYPGGNFVSGYRWEDGVGPPADRPTRIDLAWRSIESNAFGLGEFMEWTRTAGVEPMLAVNLGTRGIQEAADLVEYANHPGGTQLSDLRRQHGADKPYGIGTWCLGNEMDGPWQIGHQTATEYGRLAAETAKAMRLVDPGIELVACGSSNRGMPTFGEWERVVLEHTYEYVDYISLHNYYEERDGDLASFLASAVDMDAFINEVVATCDHVRALKRSTRQLKLSFDEWNVWYQQRFAGAQNLAWEQHRQLIQDEYSVADAVVVGSFLVTLMRHADRVGIACQAQLANIIAPIRTEPGGPAWRQTIFWPFAHAARLARGRVLRVEPVTATYDTAAYGPVDAVLLTATYDEETGDVAVFAVNRATTDPVHLSIDVRPLPGLTVTEHAVLTDDDVRASNNVHAPDRVRPRPGENATVDDRQLTVTLPPVSWTALHLTATRP